MERKGIFIFYVLFFTLLATGCAGIGASSDRTPVGIAVDRPDYTPLMSSTVGIGLTPVYPPALDNSTVSFRWHTDYGFFVSWKAPGFKVREQGADVTTDDGKVYWSYGPDDMGKEKPEVHVTLTLVDRATGRALNTTGLDIGWVNKSVATVRR